jgi:hypothetical protein
MPIFHIKLLKYPEMLNALLISSLNLLSRTCHLFLWTLTRTQCQNHYLAISCHKFYTLQCITIKYYLKADSLTSVLRSLLLLAISDNEYFIQQL